MSNTPNTIKSILNNLVWNVEAAVDGDEVDKAAQLIHQLIEREVIGEDRHTTTCYFKPEVYNNPKCTCVYSQVNAKLSDQRQRLANLMKG